MTSGGNNFNDFPENQLTRFRAVQTVLMQNIVHDEAPALRGNFAYCSNGWAGWTKFRVFPNAGDPTSRQKNKNNFRVTVIIMPSGYQALECFVATLPT